MTQPLGKARCVRPVARPMAARPIAPPVRLSVRLCSHQTAVLPQQCGRAHGDNERATAASSLRSALAGVAVAGSLLLGTPCMASAETQTASRIPGAPSRQKSRDSGRQPEDVHTLIPGVSAAVIRVRRAIRVPAKASCGLGPRHSQSSSPGIWVHYGPSRWADTSVGVQQAIVSPYLLCLCRECGHSQSRGACDQEQLVASGRHHRRASQSHAQGRRPAVKGLYLRTMLAMQCGLCVNHCGDSNEALSSCPHACHTLSFVAVHTQSAGSLLLLNVAEAKAEELQNSGNVSDTQ